MSTTDTIDIVLQVLAYLKDLRGDLGLHFTELTNGDVILEITRRSHATCDGCGEPLTGRPGPIALISPHTGRDTGSYSHRHGCGSTNAPVRATIQVLAGEDPDTIGTQIAATVRSLDAKVAADVTHRTGSIRKRLARELIIATMDGVTTGSLTQPGVILGDKGELEAWAYDPLGEDTITVTMADITVTM